MGIYSLSYKNEYDFDSDVQYGEYQKQIDPDSYEMRYATLQNGAVGERNVLVGMLGGIAYKTNFNKYRFTAMHLQNGLSRAGKFSIDNDASAVGQSGYYAESDNLEYNQRSLTNFLLSGTHVFQESGWEVDWRLSPTFLPLRIRTSGKRHLRFVRMMMSCLMQEREVIPLASGGS